MCVLNLCLFTCEEDCVGKPRQIVCILWDIHCNFDFSPQARNISDEGEYFFNEKELDEFAEMLEGIKKWKEVGEEVQKARKNYEVSDPTLYVY